MAAAASRRIQALHKSGEQADFEFGILTSVMRANDAQKTILFDPLQITSKAT